MDMAPMEMEAPEMETNPIIAALEEARAALDRLEVAASEKRKAPAAPAVEVEIEPKEA